MKKVRNTVFKKSGNIATSDYFKLLCELLDCVRSSEEPATDFSDVA